MHWNWSTSRLARAGTARRRLTSRPVSAGGRSRSPRRRAAIEGGIRLRPARAAPSRPSRSTRARLPEGTADDRLGRGRVLGDEPQLQPLALSPEGAEDDARALDGETRDLTGSLDQIAGRAADGEQGMLIALRRLEDSGLGPAAGVGHHRERERPRPDPLGIGDRHLGPGRVLAVRVRIAADEPERAQDRDGQFAPVVDQLVFGQVIEQQRHAGRVDEAPRRVGRQRHLAVSALHRQAALDDRELALGGRRRRGTGQRDVPAQSDDRATDCRTRRGRGRMAPRPASRTSSRHRSPRSPRCGRHPTARRRPATRSDAARRGCRGAARPPSSRPRRRAVPPRAGRRPAGRSCSCPRTHRHRPGARRRPASEPPPARRTVPSSSTVSFTSPFASDRSEATTGAVPASRGARRRARLDRRPAERRHLDLGQDLATVRGEHDQLPERIGGRGGGRHDLPDEFVDIELGRLADIVDQERDRRDLGVGVDARAVQLAPEQLAAMPPAPEELREPVAAQPQPGDHRVPARELLGRHRRPAHARTPARRRPGPRRRSVTRSVRVVGEGLTTAQLPSGTAAAIRCPVSLRMPRPSCSASA